MMSYKAFSTGEKIYIGVVFFIIIWLTFLTLQFPGTNQIYWGKAYPVGITAHILDEGNILKLALVNNAAERVAVDYIKLNDVKYMLSSRINPGVVSRTNITIANFTCDTNGHYSFNVEIGYSFENGESDVFKGEQPIKGKCKGI